MMDISLNEQETLISDELRKTLGDDCLYVKKIDGNKSQTNIVSPEAYNQAVKLSKSAKKRQAQIELRKEKELKRDGSYEILSKHQLPENHRELIRSTRSIGQTDTKRMAVTYLFKKYKLGLPLTESEMSILFPDGLDGESCPDADNISLTVVDSLNPPLKPETHIVSADTNDASGPLLLDLAAIMQPDVDASSTVSKRPKVKKGAKRKADNDSSADPNTNLSSIDGIVTVSNGNANTQAKPTVSNQPVKATGSTLLAQFQLLKQSLGQTVASTPSDDDTPELNLGKAGPDPEEAKVYVPSTVAVDNIISDAGLVQPVSHSADQVAEASGLSVLTKRKRPCEDGDALARHPISVSRTPDIQV